MSAWRLLLLGVLALAIKTGLALVPPLAPLADPLLVVAVLAALSGRRWSSMLTGLATGALEVRYEGGRSIRYDTFANMKARLTFLKELQSGSSAKPSSAGFASFDRGDM